LIQEYLKEYPDEVEYTNAFLGICYEQQKNYALAEKYYTQSTWFDYSKIEGLLGLSSIIFYKVMPREEAHKLLLEYWQQISDICPSSLDIKIRFYVVKNYSSEKLPLLKEEIFPTHYTDISVEATVKEFFPKDHDFSSYKSPRDLAGEAKKCFDKGDFNRAISYYQWAAYGEALLYELREGTSWEPWMGDDIDKILNPPPSEYDEKNIILGMLYWSPLCFNKIAECYIKKAELKRPLKTVIENYKIAIYYYRKACERDRNLYELNLPRIKQLRQKIRELESQLNQQKSDNK
jgi:hypothetical protein